MELRVLRVTAEGSLADEWHLCLTAVGIAHRLEPVDGKLALVVDERDLERADTTLREYDEERRARALERAAPPPPDAPSLLGPIAAALLIGFFAATLPMRGRFLEAGRLLADGEPWRAITALTLHADYMHLFGNAVAALIFFTALGRWLGSGVAALLIVVAGALANLVNAAVHPPGYSSIGASTATFAALGILAALQLLRRRTAPRWWIPVAGALGLFAMLGTAGERTDVLAHLFGLVGGFLVGVPATKAPRGRFAQILAGALAVALLGGAWLLALA